MPPDSQPAHLWSSVMCYNLFSMEDNQVPTNENSKLDDIISRLEAVNERLDRIEQRLMTGEARLGNTGGLSSRLGKLIRGLSDTLDPQGQNAVPPGGMVGYGIVDTADIKAPY